MGEALLPKEIFGLKIKSDLLHQILVSQRANRRKVIAHTKDRSEVSGGGKKPWRQKGTGRARAGSNRSPLWRGGGVTFGPRKERSYYKIIPKKMRRKALFMALSDKAREGFILILDELKLEKAKTKEMHQILKNLPGAGKKVLILLPEHDKKIILASRNIPDSKTLQAKDLNALDVLSFKYLLFPKEVIKNIQETFIKEK